MAEVTNSLVKSRRRSYAILAVTVAIAGLVLWATTGPARLSFAGRNLEVTIPSPHLRIGSSAGRASYLVLGDRDVRQFLTRNAANGWRYTEQLGSAHVLTNDSLQLVIIRQQRLGSFIVQLDLHVRRSGPTTVAP